MDSFVDYTGQAGQGQAEFQDGSDGSDERSSLEHFQHMSTSSASQAQKAAYFNSNATHSLSCEVKPRLTKEQHDILEAQYQKQSKPNTNVKKGFAESLNVSLDKVNVSTLACSSTRVGG